MTHITIERAKLEQVLEALLPHKSTVLRWYTPADVAITALKEALAQPEQEPVSVKRMVEWVDCLKSKSDYGQHMKIPSEMSSGACWELAIELEQFINTTPPQRKPLTDKQRSEIAFQWRDGNGTASEIIDMVEAAHGIKENT